MSPQSLVVRYLIPSSMWPFDSAAPEVHVENNVSTHEMVGYTIDGVMIVIVIIVIIIWKWRRNVRRLKELQSVATRLARQQEV